MFLPFTSFGTVDGLFGCCCSWFTRSLGNDLDDFNFTRIFWISSTENECGMELDAEPEPEPELLLQMQRKIKVRLNNFQLMVR